MVAFMQKGVMCVGFPDLEDIDDGLKKAVEARMEMDAEALRRLVCQSEESRLNRELFDDKWWRKFTIL